jgi:hypothetical protein
MVHDFGRTGDRHGACPEGVDERRNAIANEYRSCLVARGAGILVLVLAVLIAAGAYRVWARPAKSPTRV